VTDDELSVAGSTPPAGSTRSSTTLAVGETPVARLAGVLVRTRGVPSGTGTTST
jgi:hypothetical protein